ncbi:hypothetical protein SAMN06265222_114147 [Neorhodopirellula lusitana]|uniref:Uncharacterized protein n=1 Tax=Neorhodopirellula lusitana TaxID=445327 RepID=A0ABY1QLV8_9BACT|nr:hypothetical protein SAMN06265222_114147 [Neorhodopirellula lusitana]
MESFRFQTFLMDRHTARAYFGGLCLLHWEVNGLERPAIGLSRGGAWLGCAHGIVFARSGV